MKGDLTRDTFDPLNHYTRVLMQQGRVQLDADWNEQVAISLHHLRTLAADLIGPAGGPANNVGFKIIDAGLYPDFRIGGGHYYVDGILCEADATSIPIVPQAAATGSAFKLYVPTLLVGDVAFHEPSGTLPPQYVEIFDAGDPTKSPVITQVKDIDVSKQMITVDKNIAGASIKPRLRRVSTYLTQPDYPVPAAERLPSLNEVAASTSYLVYLDVWERHLTYLDDDSMREVALGGADTATRVKLVWQVKAIAGKPGSIPYDSACDGFMPADKEFFTSLEWANRGRLKASAKRDAQATDPCTTPFEARFRGVENQLYRVEIHNSGSAWDGNGDPPASGVATFKWSRENGVPAYPILQVSTDNTARTTTVTLENLWRDDRFGLAEGDRVEIIDDDYVLQNLAHPLLHVHAIDRSSMMVTLDGLTGDEIGKDTSKHPQLRRWDHKAGVAVEGGLQLAGDGAAFVLEQAGEAWLNLEDGVRIQFQPKNPFNAGDHFIYRTGDYWLIPARTANGDVEWPSVTDSQTGQTASVALPPQGIHHHYAPLALLTVTSAGATVGNCRKRFATQALNFSYDDVGSLGIGTKQLKKKAGGSPPK